MTDFSIPENDFLSTDINGFYHTDFGGSSLPSNPNFLYKLKNDPHHNWTTSQISEAQKELLNILITDLPDISQQTNIKPLTVCVVPRAKAENFYNENQLLFRKTIKNAVEQLNNDFIDGSSFILRNRNTKTTHLRNPMACFDNDGDLPYKGISNATCWFSTEIRDQNILLIDDIYTKTVNIDEDMIQALIDHGANSVTFYAIGKTIHRN